MLDSILLQCFLSWSSCNSDISMDKAVKLPGGFVVSTWTGTGQEVRFLLVLLLQLCKKIVEVKQDVVVRFPHKLDLTAVQAGPEQAGNCLVRKSFVGFRV